MKRTILYLFILTATQSCVAQKIKDMKNSKKIDKIYYYQKAQENCKNTDGNCLYAIFKELDGTSVEVYLPTPYNTYGYGIKRIKPLSFKIEFSSYDRNTCIIQEEGTLFYCSTIKIGIWREYDKEGNLIKETDEDKKFKGLKVTPQKLLDWFEKQGWIDRSTGKGQQEDLVTPFYIKFYPSTSKGGPFKNQTHDEWLVLRSVMGGREKYIIDAETGEITFYKKILLEE